MNQGYMGKTISERKNPLRNKNGIAPCLMSGQVSGEDFPLKFQWDWLDLPEVPSASKEDETQDRNLLWESKPFERVL